jgi:hypothetical protein
MTRRFKVAATAALGTALAFGAVGVAMAAQPGPAYLAVGTWSAEAQGQNSVRLSATTNGDIPRMTDAFIASQIIVGIAWADLGTGTALVATIHPTLGRDSFQRPDAWHLHTVQLTGGATAPNDFCLVAVASTPTAGIQIQGSTMSVYVRASEMPVAGGSPISAAAFDAAVGFTVHGGDAGCTATGLGVRVRN